METDVLVIGAGIAGLTTALSVAPKRVVLLSKGPLGKDASSSWAQGGIASALSTDDSPQQHFLDTIAVAGEIADLDIATLVTDLGPDCIETLTELGVIFDHDEKGLKLRKEAAHSRHRIVHANGDSTGKEIMRALTLQVLRSDHIQVLEDAEALDLVSKDNQARGAIVTQAGEQFSVFADATVIASGGIGQIYNATTNPFDATGDGLAMAARAGVLLKDLEFVQFHPTAIDVPSSPKPLATEALRGEGAILLNNHGERFMQAEHPLAELAPRDILARGIWRQIEQGNRCFLDTKQSTGEHFPTEFPTVFRLCQENGIDPRKELIPVVPAAHFHMGGIATDEKGRTSLNGLWACGEVACTGLHGANRLASNSLLEAFVFAKLVSSDILDQQTSIVKRPIFSPPLRLKSVVSKFEEETLSELQKLNFRHIGLCRDGDGLHELLAYLDELNQKFPNPPQKLRNSMVCSRLIAVAALKRLESRGSHYRADYPKIDPAFKYHATLTLKDCEGYVGKPNLPLTSCA